MGDGQRIGNGRKNLFLTPFFPLHPPQRLLSALDTAPWHPLSNRRVAHYVAGFDYASRGSLFPPPPAPSPPAEVAALLSRVVATATPYGLPSADQVTINDYPPGASLPRHVDTHSPFGDAVASVSLGAGAPLLLTRPRGDRRGEGRAVVYLPPRSLLILAGEARLGWEHAIKGDAGRGRRVSVTVRSRRAERVCSCSYPHLCDSKGGGPGVTRDAAAAAAAVALAAATDASAAAAAAAAARAAGAAGAAAVETTLVRAVYDRIAPHFDATRVAVWPQVASFLDSIRGGLIADVGCGNGKYMGVEKNASRFSFSIGVDPCARLAAAASARPASDAIVADGSTLPLRSSTCDGVLCIAVVHHFASRPRRRALIERVASLARRSGGRALVTVWAVPAAQPRGRDAARAAKWRALEGRGDFLVPWHEPPGWTGGKDAAATTPRTHTQHPPVAWRFYHCYEGSELGEDAAAAAARVEGACVERVFADRGNWCAVIVRD